MADLKVVKIPDINMTVIYFKDSCVPYGVKAFFRLDSRRPDKAKIRIKDEGRILHGHQRNDIAAYMDRIARENDYSFSRMVERYGR